MALASHNKLFGILFIFAYRLVEAPPSAVPKFPNINCLSYGYDYFQGNPLSGGSDPGWKSTVFQFSYSNEEVSSDEKYRIPDTVEASYTPVCDYDLNSYEYYREDELRNSLEKSASTEAGIEVLSIFSAGFSASNSFKTMSESMKSQHRVFTDAIASCQSYRLQHKSLIFTEGFKEAVAELPLSYNKEEYLKFLEEFGTHVVGEIWYGSKYTLNSELTEEAAKSMQASGQSAAYSAKISLMGKFGIHASHGTSFNKETSQRFSEMRKTFSMRVRGAEPPNDGDMEAWLAKSSRMPNPIVYKKMKPLTEILKSKNFPEMNKKNLDVIRENLKTAFKDHCASLRGCHEIPKK